MGNPISLVDMDDDNRRLRQTEEKLAIAYDNLRRTLCGTVPQEMRRYADKYRSDLQQLIVRTEKHTVENSIQQSDSRSSRISVSSQKALLAAKAASLKVEIEARQSQNQTRTELQHLEVELEKKKQLLEDQKVLTELRKAEAELPYKWKMLGQPNYRRYHLLCQWRR